MPTFSPDGRLLAVQSAGIRVWEVSTGRVIIDLPRNSGGTDTMAFSSDGRLLAALGTQHLVIWDLGRGKSVANYPAELVTGGLVFSPDGRLLAAGHANGTILLWKVPRPADQEIWSESNAASLWNNLRDPMPANAYAAIWQLAGRPAVAVRFLKRKYPLVPAIPPAESKKLIAALDSGRFAEREAASKRLRELGQPAVTPLRQASTMGRRRNRDGGSMRSSQT